MEPRSRSRTEVEAGKRHCVLVGIDWQLALYVLVWCVKGCSIVYKEASFPLQSYATIHQQTLINPSLHNLTLLELVCYRDVLLSTEHQRAW